MAPGTGLTAAEEPRYTPTLAAAPWSFDILASFIQLGQVVLINGATGVSGRMAVQAARIRGAGRINTDTPVRSKKKTAPLNMVGTKGHAYIGSCSLPRRGAPAGKRPRHVEQLTPVSKQEGSR